MRLLKTENHASGQVLFNVPQGRYAGLFIRFAGTNAAGATLALANLGQIRVNHENTEIINTTPGFFSALTNLYFGVAEAASAIGAAYTFSFYVPFRTKYDRNNVVPVRTDKTQLVLQSFNTALVAAGTIEIYGIESEGSARYVPIIKDDQDQFAAAGTRQKTFAYRNVEQVYVVNDAALTLIQVKQDGVPKVDGTFAAINAFANAFNSVETAQTLIEVVAPKSDLPQNVAQTELRLTASGAIATVFITFFAIAPYAK